MKVTRINQWRSPAGSRDISWLVIESSRFRYPTYIVQGEQLCRNIHVFLCGFGISVWY